MYVADCGRMSTCILKWLVYYVPINLIGVYEFCYLCTRNDCGTDDFVYVHANTLNDHSHFGLRVYMCKS